MSRAQLLNGDALTVLRSLPPGVVRCCVTSPPYWGLRDYGTGTWDGGDVTCSHQVGGQVQDTKAPGAITTGQRPGVDSSQCRRCGARRVDHQLGLERTPEEYVSRMVELFREVRRVLADDGTLWLNLGDSYAASPGQRKETDKAGEKQQTKRGSTGSPSRHVESLKPKDLVGIPWRVAFALQADGWYLRSDIIWAKSNPMPESVTDRPTKAHEYVFLLSKSPRYYYDADAIAEPASPESEARYGYAFGGGKASHLLATDQVHTRPIGNREYTATRNARTVWSINTQPYSGAHFATMPEELARRCILAGSAPGDTVLDPFSGSGTTASVAVGNGRAAIGIELNPAYQELARQRVGPMFCDDAA